MNRQPDYRRRRIVVAAMALGLLALSQREMPVIGTISIDVDAGHAPQIAATLAPPLDRVAMVMIDIGGRLIR
ncbi:hypothetical protein [Sphingomonas ginsenosidimutans]|jgi:hypothetical protein|uniref:Uncharacterized protein n=1 Tax=Sphingomonas ginsenosidimutans TaxID=862134 RepID=A0A2A4I0X8_9SPHN|nr:hypothetical protein [Sphingomonas ginsenosidimutans]MBY0300764.1 hypothetical protein [Sphingomonas ginsenosidimutans]MEE2915595.1 hypothetical protein [Pseudomonadota bacterium]PCG09585.1 hypothetical protein COA17_06870 [Sphingomonas ginsenosidimutans]